MLKKALLGMLMAACMPLLAEFDLVVDGRPAKQAYIVLDIEATPTAQYAAREFAEYIEKICGADFFFEPGFGTYNKNVVIGYGDVAKKAGFTLDGLKHDGFRIVTRGNSLFIFGRDRASNHPVIGGNNHLSKGHTYDGKYDISIFGDSGTLYGVYYFLREYLGVRWFLPGEDGEVVPKRTKITIPDIDITVNPDFEYRVDYVTLLHNNHDFARWYRRAGFGAPAPVEINHTFMKMNRFQKEHPEWFALHDGKRDFNITCEGEGNLCLSQPGLVDAFAKDACAYFDAHPEQEIYSVMPNDWHNCICECEECQKQADYDKPEIGHFSNYIWGFVDKVARKVAETHPDKFIGCCAYSKYMLIPDRVDLAPNVAVMITKAVYARYLDIYRLRCDDYAQAWAHKTKRFYCWDYYCWDNTNSHLSGLPIFFPHWLQDNLRSLKGVSIGQFIEAGGVVNYRFPYPAHNAITHYLTGRLMWDASLDVDALLEEYYTMFFGPAGPEMKKYWTRAEELWCNMDVKKRGPVDGINTTIYTPEALTELKGYLAAAEKLTEDGTVYRKRVKDVQDILYPYVDKVNNVSKDKRVANVKTVESAPVIDGVMDDCWKQAAPLDFVLQTDGRKPVYATNARVLHDKDNLYVFVSCECKNKDNLVAECKTNDSNLKPYIWDDDAVEIFISPNSFKPYCTIQMIVNANGVLWDGCHNFRQYPAEKMTEYNTGALVKAGRYDKGWTVEIAIPKKKLEIDGNNLTNEWRANFCRDCWVNEIDSKSMERSCWSPIFHDAWNVPARFGYLSF